MVYGPGLGGPTSSGVYLYYDPCSLPEAVPILYADTEGFDGGETEPVGQTFAKSPRHRRERAISWATKQTQKAREYYRRAFYPRLMYTFSDVIIYVVQNSGVVESVLQILVNRTASGMETSSNQPMLPHAFIVLNTAGPAADPSLWNVDASTRVLLESLKSAIWDNSFLRKAAEECRDREDQLILLNRFYSVTILALRSSEYHLLVAQN